MLFDDFLMFFDALGDVVFASLVLYAFDYDRYGQQAGPRLKDGYEQMFLHSF